MHLFSSGLATSRALKILPVWRYLGLQSCSEGSYKNVARYSLKSFC